MCVRKQLRECGSVRVKTLRTQKFVSFVPASPQKKKCGRHRKWDPDEIREAVKLIPLFKRRTIWDLAHALAIPKSTLF